VTDPLTDVTLDDPLPDDEGGEVLDGADMPDRPEAPVDSPEPDL